MRLADILRMAVAALAQQKVRTLLTTLGVTFGTFVLVLSLSAGQGVQEMILRESRRFDRLRKIDVWAGWAASEKDIPAAALEVKGAMSDARRQRLRQAIIDNWARDHQAGPRVTLNRERLDTLAALPHVEAVVPRVQAYGWLLLDGRAEQGSMSAVPPDDKALPARRLAGDLFTAPDERSALVSEYLLYRWGVADDDAVRAVPGRRLRVEFRASGPEPGLRLYVVKAGEEGVSREEERLLDRVVKELPQAADALHLSPEERAAFRKLAVPAGPGAGVTTVAEEFTIRGVLREPTREEREAAWDSDAYGDVILPLQTAEELTFRLPWRAERGFDRAFVTVDSEENVKGVAREIEATGLQSHAAVEFIERERFQFLLIFGAMGCVAGVALLVAALGITNTMLMSVLERTREIGVMKAVGARDRDVLAVFVVEGVVIGLAGGGLGLLLAWAASIPGDAWVRSMVARDMKIELRQALFVFPAWLALGSVAFAVVVTTLAALYPARRAARLRPIAALRHE